MDDKYQELYGYMSSQNMTDLDAQEFFDAYSRPEKFESLWSYVVEQDLTDLSKDMFYDSYFGSVKKKPNSQQESLLEEVSTESTSDTNQVEPKGLGDSDYGVAKPKEQQFLKGDAGNFINAIPVIGDFADDMARAISRGSSRNKTIDETYQIMADQSNVDLENVSKYVQSINDYNEEVASIGQSDEMMSYSNSLEGYKEKYGDWFGTFAAMGDNLSVLPEVMVESMAGMLNGRSLKEASKVVGLGVGTGAGLGSFAGGVGAAPGALLGGARSLPFAMAAAGYEVEALSSFTEFLKEELGDREFSPENVLSVLSDDEAYKRIRNRSVKRGKTISAIDAIGGAVLSRSFRAVKATTKLANLGVVAAEATGEAVLGGVGESAARVAADQPQSAEEIIMEGAAGLGGLPATLASTYLGKKKTKDIEDTSKPIRKSTTSANKPVYSVNGDEVDAETLMDFVDTATPDELKSANISIDNDQATSDKVSSKMKRSLIEDVLPDGIEESDKSRLVELEEERKRLASSDTQSAKRRLSKVDEEIEVINSRYDEPIAASEEGPTTPTVSEQLNRIVVMEDGTKGELRRDTEYGNRVVIETDDKIIDLGNADEVMDSPMSDLKLTEDKSQIEITPDGNIVYDGNEFGVQRDLPTRGIDYDENGEVSRVSLKDSEGNTTMLEGQEAQDAAYQILLDQAQSPDQEQRVNEILEQDEEFQREHDDYVRRKQEDLAGGAEAVIDDAEVKADEVPSEAPETTASELIQEDTPATETDSPGVDEQAKQEMSDRKNQEDLYVKTPALEKLLKSPKRFFADILTGRTGFQRRYFSSRSFLSKSTFLRKEAKDAKIAKTLSVVDQTTKKFNRVYSSVPKENQQGFVNDFDNYLRGGGAGNLSVEAMDLANELRAQIDRLSVQLINEGVINESRLDAVTMNIGKYLTRSYRVFDDPKALRAELEAEEGQATINRAKNFIRERERAQAIKDAKDPLKNPKGLDEDAYLESVVDGYVDKYLDKESAFNLIGKGRLGSKDLNMLKKQKDIPVEIRALMGEYTDPMQNYARSVMRMVAAAESAKFLNSVKSIGEGVFLFDKPNPPFSVQIAAEGSETMSPLNGMYTTKEIAEQFDSTVSQSNAVLENYMKVIATVKWMKTIASFGTHSKNVTGNLGFMLVNGHTDFTQMGEAFRIIKNDLGKSDNEALNAKLNKYIELGIIKQSAGLGEIRDMFKDADFDDALMSRLSDQKLSNDASRLKKASLFAKRKGLQGKKKLEDLYQAEDDFFKIVAFENEKNRYSEAMFGKKPSELSADQIAQLDSKVAEIVKNTYPTYSRVPEAIKMLRKSPLIGNFVSFQAESYRVAYNTIAIGKQEIAEGSRTGNKKLVRIGLKRLLGAASYMGIKTAALGVASTAAGAGVMGLFGSMVDSEEEKQKQNDIKYFVAPWSKNSDAFLFNVEDGKFSYIDVSASDPYGGINKVANAFSTNGFSKGIVEIFAPFIDTDIATKRLLNMYGNQDDYGRSIYNEEDTDVNKAANLLSYAYKVFEPGTVTSIRKIYKADNSPTEIIGQLTGLKPYNVDILKQSQFKIKELKDRLSEAKRLKYDNLDQANDAAKKIQKEMYELSERAQRLGVSRADIAKAFMDWGGMSRTQAIKVINDITTPINAPRKD